MEYHRVNTARTSLTVKCWTRVTGWKVPISPILLFCHFVAFVALMVSSRSWTIAIFFELSWRQTSPQFHSGWYLLTVSSVTCTADNPEVKEIVILSNSRNLHERRINTTYNRDFHVWLSCGSWHDRQVLCKYCSIIALICVTPVWCVPCFPRYIFCDLNVKCISCITQPVVHCLSHLRCCCCKFDRCGIRAKGGVRAT